MKKRIQIVKNWRKNMITGFAALLLFAACSEKVDRDMRTVKSNDKLTKQVPEEKTAIKEPPAVQKRTFNAQEYASLISDISDELPLKYTGTVKYYIDDYTVKGPNELKKMIIRSHKYFPMIDKVFAKYDIPAELRYLAMVESKLDPDARSHAGAVGLWQFMRPTARDMGLVGRYDNRRNAYRSTVAAAKYLKRLHNRFDDWFVVLAAYNYGQGNVSKAIRRAGGKKDFWAIQRYLPRETRNYVPKFIAATYVMNYYDDHGIEVDSRQVRLAKREGEKQLSLVS